MKEMTPSNEERMQALEYMAALGVAAYAVACGREEYSFDADGMRMLIGMLGEQHGTPLPAARGVRIAINRIADLASHLRPR